MRHCPLTNPHVQLLSPNVFPIQMAIKIGMYIPYPIVRQNINYHISGLNTSSISNSHVFFHAWPLNCWVKDPTKKLFHVIPHGPHVFFHDISMKSDVKYLWIPMPSHKISMSSLEMQTNKAMPPILLQQSHLCSGDWSDLDTVDTVDTVQIWSVAGHSWWYGHPSHTNPNIMDHHGISRVYNMNIHELNGSKWCLDPFFWGWQWDDCPPFAPFLGQ